MDKRNTRYSPEVQERAVRLVASNRKAESVFADLNRLLGLARGPSAVCCFSVSLR